MEALIFAAGLGSRLGPLTRDTPKALIEVGGRTLLERVALRLVDAGVDRIVVNVHPFADRIARVVEEHHGFGADVVLSHEEERPLETGGGLAHARSLLRGDGPILLHNVDVLTDLPLTTLLEAHRASAALATLAVMERPTQRFLLFDDRGLVGRIDTSKDLEILARPPQGTPCRLAFSGVHVIAPALLDRIEESGVFSILEPYLRLASEGESLRPFRVDGSTWIDVGRPDDLERARRRFPRPST